MAIATFGMSWQVSGTQQFEIPDGIDPMNEAAVSDYLLQHWSEIPIPEDGEYIGDSDILDGVFTVEQSNQKQKTLQFTVERAVRTGFDKVLSEAEYEDFLQTGNLPFDVYREAGFPGDDGAEYSYAVTDEEGRTLVDWT